MAEQTIPLVQEQAEVSKRTRTTGTVRVEKVVREFPQPIEATLQSQTIEVKRVPVDRFVDGPVPDRQDGDTLIVSVLEEVLVVQKRLKVVEEIHLVRHSTTEEVHDEITLRRDEAQVKRESL